MQNPRAFTMPRIAGAATISALAVAAVAMPGVANAATAHAAAPALTAAPVAATVQNAAPVTAAPIVAQQPAPVSAPAAAPAAAPQPATYTVHSGDTLSGIAKKNLGAADRYTEIFDLNKGKAQPTGGSLTSANVIQPGWVLTLPGGAPKAATSAVHSAPVAQAAPVAKTVKAVTAAAPAAPATGSFTNNLDGWIKQAQAILAQHGVTVSYNAIYQTAMHESAGNPSATNGWDSNAAAGHPSIGLMQTIQPTFNAYALPGHSNIYNPVDNIIAAARYAQSVYGGLDKVVAARGGGSNWYGY